MADVGQENSEIPEMMPSSLSSKFSSNSAMVATAWHLTRKKKKLSLCLPGLPALYNYKIIYTLVYKLKRTYLSKQSVVKCTCYFLVVFIYDRALKS